MIKPKPPTYRTPHWHDYKAALARRRSLAIWFDPETQWLAAPTDRPGRQPDFTHAAIQACLTLKALFWLPLRQTTGMVGSPLDLAGLQRPLPPPEDLDCPHPLSSQHRRLAHDDRQHGR